MTNKERETYVKEIATVTLSQLLANKDELLSWGAEKYICRDKEVDKCMMPTLSFKIKTAKVPRSGYVEISLNEGEDLYVVEAFTATVKKRKSLGVFKQVYSEDLHEVINRLIRDK